MTAVVPWHDIIKTAPRDGTEIVVYRPGDQSPVGMDKWTEYGWWRSRPHLPPTHWMHVYEIKPIAAGIDV